MAGLRRKVGTDPIIMVCGSCAVVDDAGRLLLQQRADAGSPWGLPGGAMELGETLEQAALREVLEETGLHVRADALVGVYSHGQHTYDNGDVVQAVVTLFAATVVGGELTPDGVETLDLGWFALDALPEPLFAPHHRMLADLVAGRRGAWG
jgi:8-oxo-dGTP pyrophosphatase MutT (NUDIX family)